MPNDLPPVGAEPSPSLDPATPAAERSSPVAERSSFLDDIQATPCNSGSTTNSPVTSRPGSAIGGRVRFGHGEAVDPLGNRIALHLLDANSPQVSPERIPAPSPPQIDLGSYFTEAVESPDRTQEISSPSSPSSPSASIVAPPRCFKYKRPTIQDSDEMDEKHDGFSANDTVTRERVPKNSGNHSAPNSARSSPTLAAFSVGTQIIAPVDDIPMLDVSQDNIGQGRLGSSVTTEAHQLVRQYNHRDPFGGGFGRHTVPLESSIEEEMPSGYNTPMERGHGDYVKKPEQFRGGVLASLLTLYNNGSSSPQGHHGHQSTASLGGTTISGRQTPKWYSKSANTSTASLSGTAVLTPIGGAVISQGRKERPKLKHRPYSNGFVDKIKHISRPNLEEEIKITIHIADLLQRQRYILKICRALMLYGAPTHRLEEALKMTARVLSIDAQFLYIPGCMIIAFGDQSTHTSEMQVVRTAQGLDMGKLHDCHLVYKEVVHDIIGVEEASQRLDVIINAKPKHNVWFQIFFSGIASAAVGPFGFKARFIDMPILFILGCLLGFLQLVLAPRSELYSNVFEISAAIAISFFSRMFGSINGGSLFCFSALTQGSISLILPGYIILCGSLELQSKNMVAGSVRMFYAIIYSLFLGFGITVGSALYGLIDKNATSETTCSNPLDWKWNIFFVPLFSLCLLAITQAKWRQAPVMVFIALAGYLVNYFSGQQFVAQPQIAGGLGAFTVGVLGNIYSRAGHGLAFAAMLPAIFVQVPGGLAAQGSLLSAIGGADAILENSTSTPASAMGTNSIMFEFGFSMIQIAIGITVGLFAAALVVYPLPKRRSGLFSF